MDRNWLTATKIRITDWRDNGQPAGASLEVSWDDGAQVILDFDTLQQAEDEAASLGFGRFR